MAEMAFTPEPRHVVVELAVEKTKAAGGLLKQGAAWVTSGVGAIFTKISETTVFGWLKDVMAKAFGFTKSQLKKLSKVGLVATILTVATSERGQKVLGKLVGFTWSSFDAIVRVAVRALSILPWVGKPISGALDGARLWLNNKVADLHVFAKNNAFCQALHHEGWISRKVRMVAGPVALFSIVRHLLPGPMQILGYVGLAGWLGYKALSSPAPEAAVVKLENARDKVDRIKVSLEKADAEKPAKTKTAKPKAKKAKKSEPKRIEDLTAEEIVSNAAAAQQEASAEAQPAAVGLVDASMPDSPQLAPQAAQEPSQPSSGTTAPKETAVQQAAKARERAVRNNIDGIRKAYRRRAEDSLLMAQASEQWIEDQVTGNTANWNKMSHKTRVGKLTEALAPWANQTRRPRLPRSAEVLRTYADCVITAYEDGQRDGDEGARAWSPTALRAERLDAMIDLAREALAEFITLPELPAELHEEFASFVPPAKAA